MSHLAFSSEKEDLIKEANSRLMASIEYYETPHPELHPKQNEVLLDKASKLKSLYNSNDDLGKLHYLKSRYLVSLNSMNEKLSKLEKAEQVKFEEYKNLSIQIKLARKGLAALEKYGI